MKIVAVNVWVNEAASCLDLIRVAYDDRTLKDINPVGLLPMDVLKFITSAKVHDVTPLDDGRKLHAMYN